jgi:hypothetical protein
LALKTRHFALLLPGILLIAAAIWLFAIHDRTGEGWKLNAKTGNYVLEVVTSGAAQTKGLGGRDSMPRDHGMIFTYTDDAARCFWMQDMRYALDIVWADTQKHVTHVEYSLKPETYPQQYCASAQYVIELNSGEARKNDIRTGAQLHF